MLEDKKTRKNPIFDKFTKDDKVFHRATINDKNTGIPEIQYEMKMKRRIHNRRKPTIRHAKHSGWMLCSFHLLQVTAMYVNSKKWR